MSVGLCVPVSICCSSIRPRFPVAAVPYVPGSVRCSSIHRCSIRGCICLGAGRCVGSPLCASQASGGCHLTKRVSRSPPKGKDPLRAATKGKLWGRVWGGVWCVCPAEPPHLRPLCTIALPQPGPRGSQGSCGWQGPGSRSPFLFQPLPGEPSEGSSCPNLMGRVHPSGPPRPLRGTAPSTPSTPLQLPRPAPLEGFIPGEAAGPQDAGTQKTSAAERHRDAAGGGSSRRTSTPRHPPSPNLELLKITQAPFQAFFKPQLISLKR